MKVSPYLVSVSAAIISLSLNTSVYSARFEPFIIEKDLCDLGMRVSSPIRTVEEEWEVVDVTLRNGEISDYDQHMIEMAKAWERVGGAGTLFPDAEGANVQNWGRRLVSVGKFTFKLAAPFIVTAVPSEGTEQLFSYATPWVKQYAGDRAAEAVSHPCPLNPLPWWENCIPYKAAIARDIDEAAAVDLMNDFKTTVQIYSAPLAVGAYTAGSGLYTNALEPLGRRIVG